MKYPMYPLKQVFIFIGLMLLSIILTLFFYEKIAWIFPGYWGVFYACIVGFVVMKVSVWLGDWLTPKE